ncbi:MAG: thiolase domain-containing protein [Chloroflexi bacterium]|nr:thiolase domain-containing protein [Chloroflexota bacterium]
MPEVAIAGIGQTGVGEHWDVSLRELGFRAMDAAMQDAGGIRPSALFVGNMLAPSLSRQAHLGALLADFAGLTGIESILVEAAGASGAAALRQGYLAVRSGMVDSALVVGVEKFTDTIGPGAEAALATASDSDHEALHGLTPTAQAALIMQRYLFEYGVPQGGLAGFAQLAHANGAGNPNAMYQKAIKPEAYLETDMVCDPVNLFDIAPLADGAAAVLLARLEDLPAEHPYPPVVISGSGQASDTLALHDREDPLAFSALKMAAGKAFQQAGLTTEAVDFLEYHDAYSVFAALSLEASGFAAPGKGWELARAGELSLDGWLPCATLGGLKARGNPGGATGVYQAVEAALQLRELAGRNQVKGARVGMIQSLGGPAATAVCHILARPGN